MDTRTFDEILQDVPFAVLLITDGGLIKSMNGSAEVLFGYRDGELVDKNIKAIIPNGVLVQLAANGKSEVESNQSTKLSLELSAKKKNGNPFPAKITLRRYQFNDELNFLAFIEDLTTEKNLSEKFAKIFYKSPAAKILSEAESGRMVDVNDTFCRLTGYTREELIGKTSIEIGFFSSTADREKLVQAIRATGRVENIDLTITTKEKKTIHLLLSADMLELNAEHFLLTTCIDITKQKKYEKTLSKHADILAQLNEADTRLWRTGELKKGIDEILSSMLKLSGTGMANIQLLDPTENMLKLTASRGLSEEFQERFSSVNPKENTIYARAFRQGAPIGVPDIEQDDHFKPDLEVSRKEGIRGILSIPLMSSNGSSIGMISVYKRKAGPFDPVLVTIMELYAKKVEGYIEMNNINRALTGLNESLEVKVDERTDELSRALLREKELNDLKSRFVSMASHEFRTPLSTIMSSASLIQQYKATEKYDKLDKHISRIKLSINHLTQILNDFLSLGKLEEGKVEVNLGIFDLRFFFSELIEEVQSFLRPDQTIDLKCDQKIRQIESDSRILKNILLNLISNASKYSDPGKSITLECEKQENKILFHVHDQGIGIPPEDQKHLFNRFFRASNIGNIQGTGLGLNIVKRYVDLLSGEITFDSEYGKGTSFHVTIPQGV